MEQWRVAAAGGRRETVNDCQCVLYVRFAAFLAILAAKLQRTERTGSIFAGRWWNFARIVCSFMRCFWSFGSSAGANELRRGK